MLCFGAHSETKPLTPSLTLRTTKDHDERVLTSTISLSEIFGIFQSPSSWRWRFDHGLWIVIPRQYHIRVWPQCIVTFTFTNLHGLLSLLRHMTSPECQYPYTGLCKSALKVSRWRSRSHKCGCMSQRVEYGRIARMTIRNVRCYIVSLTKKKDQVEDRIWA